VSIHSSQKIAHIDPTEPSKQQRGIFAKQKNLTTLPVKPAVYWPNPPPSLHLRLQPILGAAAMLEKV
jgi:hypothetical protein